MINNELLSLVHRQFDENTLQDIKSSIDKANSRADRLLANAAASTEDKSQPECTKHQHEDMEVQYADSTPSSSAPCQNAQSKTQNSADISSTTPNEQQINLSPQQETVSSLHCTCQQHSSIIYLFFNINSI